MTKNAAVDKNKPTTKVILAGRIFPLEPWYSLLKWRTERTNHTRFGGFFEFSCMVASSRRNSSSFRSSQRYGRQWHGCLIGVQVMPWQPQDSIFHWMEYVYYTFECAGWCFWILEKAAPYTVRECLSRERVAMIGFLLMACQSNWSEVYPCIIHQRKSDHPLSVPWIALLCWSCWSVASFVDVVPSTLIGVSGLRLETQPTWSHSNLLSIYSCSFESLLESWNDLLYLRKGRDDGVRM